MHAHLYNGSGITQAVFSAATTGDIVAAVANKVISVWGCNFQAIGTVAVTLKQGSTALEGVRTLAAGVPVEIKHPVPGLPAFKTASGAAFGVTLSGATQVSGSVWYSVD